MSKMRVNSVESLDGQSVATVADLAKIPSIETALDKRTTYVGSVAELETLSLAVGTNVYLTEDGRAGEFVAKSGTPPSDPQKGIYIVLDNGNYAERAEKSSLNAKWFGAKGDGATDDVAAIQAACDMVSSGGTLHIPKGDYPLSTAVNVNGSGFQITGSRGTTITVTGAEIHNAFIFVASTYIEISGLRFYWGGTAMFQNATDWPSNYALKFEADPTTYDSCHDVTVRDCYFEECAGITTSVDATAPFAHDDAINLDANKRYYNFKITHNTFVTNLVCDQSTVDCMFLSGYRIENNTFRSGLDSCPGIRQVGASSITGGLQHSENGIVQGNLLIGKRYGMYFGAGRHHLVANNTLQGHNNEGIDFEASYDCSAIDNVLTEVRYPLALFYYFGGIVFRGNVINLRDDAVYALNHVPVNTYPESRYGDIDISDNIMNCPGGAVRIQLNGALHHVTIKNNKCQNIQISTSVGYKSLKISDNSFVFDRNSTATTTKVLVSDHSASFPGTFLITGNSFIATTGTGTPLAGRVIDITQAGAFENEIYIERNEFKNLQRPISWNSDTVTSFGTLFCRHNTLINYEIPLYMLGASSSGAASFIFEKLVGQNGEDIFGSPAAFTGTTTVDGCGFGSKIEPDSAHAGGVAYWFNSSSTGTPVWQAVSMA